MLFPFFSACVLFGLDGLPLNKEGLAQLLREEDADTLDEKVGTPGFGDRILKIDPDAAYFVAERLEEKRLFVRASELYRAQVMAPRAASAVLAFKSWIRVQGSRGAEVDARTSVGQADALFDKLDPREFEYDDARLDYLRFTLGLAPDLESPREAAKILERTLAWFRSASSFGGGTEESADSDSGGAGSADGREIALGDGTSADVPGVLALGEFPYPSWLVRSGARLLLELSRKAEDLDALLPVLAWYGLAYPAETGHGLLASAYREKRLQVYAGQGGGAETGTPRVSSPTPPFGEAESEILDLLEAKGRLAASQPEMAYAWFKDKLAESMAGLLRTAFSPSPKPLGGAEFAPLSSFADLPKRLFVWGLYRDVYEASRLSGRYSDGAALLADLQEIDTRNFLKNGRTNPRSESAGAYLDELAGRLVRFRGDHAEALRRFELALGKAKALEDRKLLSAQDRRRILWYALRSVIDTASAPEAPLFSVKDYLRLAKFDDDPVYFSDVHERALLLAGFRSAWDILETLYREIGPKLDRFQTYRYNLILARVSQIRGKSDPESLRVFNERLSLLTGQRFSLYYARTASWLAGVDLDVGGFLKEQALQRERQEREEVSRVPADFRELIRSYWAFGRQNAGLTLLWKYRAKLDSRLLEELGEERIRAGEYRQGLRFLEALRYRFGHPASEEALRLYYPRAYQPEISGALQNTQIPAWLFYSMVRTESNFDVGAKSGPGAQGLAQIMPATAEALARTHGFASEDVNKIDVNLRLGSLYLQEQYGRFGSWPLALAAYNAGQGRVASWLRSGLSSDPLIFSELVPFEETRNYIRRIAESSLLYAYLYQKADLPSVFTQFFYRKVE